MRQLSAVLTLIFFLSACQGGTDFGSREKGAAAGGALGAGLGAIIGHKTGGTGAGIAIGAAAGALAGGLIGNEIDRQDAVLNERDNRIVQQEQQIEDNRRMIEELRLKGADVYSTNRGVVVNLPDILFEFDSSRVTMEARSTTREVAGVITGYPGRRVSVEGHTDSTGTVSYNKKLSEDRARAVANELVSNGVSRGRIGVYGYGESDPIASNNNEAGRTRNRRVEIIIENRQ